MRPRRAEKRHNAIALYLVDDAIVAMDGIFHEVEHGLQAAHTRFGISQAINQTRRISDVSEQHRETLEFAAADAQLPEQLVRIQRDRGNMLQRASAMAAKATV